MSNEWGEIQAGLNNLPAHRGSRTRTCKPSPVQRGDPGPVDMARTERDAEDREGCGGSSALCPSETREVKKFKEGKGSRGPAAGELPRMREGRRLTAGLSQSTVCSVNE